LRTKSRQGISEKQTILPSIRLDQLEPSKIYAHASMPGTSTENNPLQRHVLLKETANRRLVTRTKNHRRLQTYVQHSPARSASFTQPKSQIKHHRNAVPTVFPCQQLTTKRTSAALPLPPPPLHPRAISSVPGRLPRRKLPNLADLLLGHPERRSPTAALSYARYRQVPQVAHDRRGSMFPALV
jgi:hypothetical protein